MTNVLPPSQTTSSGKISSAKAGCNQPRVRDPDLVLRRVQMSANLISAQARAGESSPVEGMHEGEGLKAEVFQAYFGVADAVINLGVKLVLLLPLLIGF